MAKFEVAALLDESGSMLGNVTGALDGVNGFFQTLREQPSDLRVSLAKFSDEMRYIYQRKYLAQLRDVSREDYAPEGGTLLYDSVLAIVRDLEPVMAEARDTHAVVVIVTDGADTDSSATEAQVARVVKEKVATGRWSFLYFGPGGEQAYGMGIPKASTFRLSESNEGIKAAFKSAAEETVRLLTAGAGPIAL